MQSDDRVYAEFRPLLFSVSYRMLGSVSEAEDVVQETFLRWHQADAEAIRNPRAWLTTTATRLAIDHLRSARARREQYVGSWLPEPLLADGADPASHAETADSLSLAFLVLLENLTPVERAVFLLREVFDYGYGEIAGIVGRSEENCRQIAVRARRHVEAGRPRFDASGEERDELARRFFAACEEGDADGLLELLAADAAMYGDGGGKAPAIGGPLHGRDAVGRVVLALTRTARELGCRPRAVVVNGQPGAVYLDAAGRIVNVVALDVAGGRIQAVRSIVNPDKLRHLGPVADVAALLRRRRAT